MTLLKYFSLFSRNLVMPCVFSNMAAAGYTWAAQPVGPSGKILPGPTPVITSLALHPLINIVFGYLVDIFIAIN